MRLWIAVREGDWTATKHGPFGNRIAWPMTEMERFRTPGDPDRLRAWHELDETTLAKAVPVDSSQETLIGTLATEARRAAQASGHARGSKDVQDYWEFLGSWLESPVTGKRFDPQSTVADAELVDGDLVVLCIEWDIGLDYMIGPSANPEMLFQTLQLAASVERITSTPRLWGALLYTDEDAELATCVRSHFDELNALSGPLLSIFVVERPASWARARRYWRQHLEPPLLRSFSAMRWLLWLPYDRHRCYDIARALGVLPTQLPCLVLFRGADPNGPLIFPIESASPGYLRGLFSEIQQAIGQEPRSYDIAEALEESRGYRWEPDSTAEAQDTLALMASTRIADSEAFDRVAAAQDHIREQLRPATQPDESGSARYEFRGHTVFMNQGAPMTENFNFYGQTTFINRPINTVIQDFQNTHAPSPERDHLTELLRLVLSTTQLPDADKETAARAVHEITGELAATKPDKDTVKTKLTALRKAVTKTADIAEPSLSIIAKLTELL